MTTKTVYLSGTANWAKLKDPDMKFSPGFWTIDLSMDKDSLSTFKSLGTELKVRENNTVKFRRPVKKLVKGDLVEYEPPTLLDKDNNPINTLVGNGSKVTIKLQVYDTAKGKGHRLESVRVEELVEYKKDEVVGSINLPF